MKEGHKKLFEAIESTLNAAGLPGGFIMIFQENEAGATGLFSTVPAPETLRALETASSELKGSFNTTETRQ